MCRVAHASQGPTMCGLCVAGCSKPSHNEGSAVHDQHGDDEQSRCKGERPGEPRFVCSLSSGDTEGSATRSD